MANNVYGAVALTGGGTGALDRAEIDGDNLADLDFAFVSIFGTTYPYTLDDNSGAAESSPRVITPDVNAGTKRWILNSINCENLTISGGKVLAGAGASGILTLGGVGGTNNEDLTFDFESFANAVLISSNSGLGTIIFSKTLRINDDFQIQIGSAADSVFAYETTGNDNLQLGLGVGTVDQSGYFSIMEKGNLGDANRSPSGTSADPVLRIYSSDATQAADYIEFFHDQTDAKINWGNGSLKIANSSGLGQIVLPQQDIVATPTLAFGDGDTGFYESVDDTLKVGVAGAIAGSFLTSGFVTSGLTANGAAILNNNGLDNDVQIKGLNNDNLIYCDAGNDRVGIGTNAPDQVLHVAGNSKLAGNVAVGGTTIDSNIVLTTSKNITDAASAQFGANFQINPSITVANAQDHTGGRMKVSCLSNAFNLTGALIGCLGEFQSSNTATISKGYGVQGLTYNTSTGTLTDGIGGNFIIRNLNASGVITNAYGVQASVASNSGTLHNTYGVYVGDITTGTQTNTPFSFYASDAGTYNYFAGNVGIGTTTPNANALLDITSTTKAFMPPRMTTTQRDAIATPTAGMVVYNSTTNVLNFYNGSIWGAV